MKLKNRRKNSKGIPNMNENSAEIRCQCYLNHHQPIFLTIFLQIRRLLLELLLNYNCSPIAFYKGRSALDIAMSKDNSIFDVFIKDPKTDLNSVINQSNQSMLLKLFSFPYFRSISSKVRLQRVR